MSKEKKPCVCPDKGTHVNVISVNPPKSVCARCSGTLDNDLDGLDFLQKGEQNMGEGHPVALTLDAFEKVFEAIGELALIGRIDPTEDGLLAGIVDQLHELHEKFGGRELLDALKSNGNTIIEDKLSNLKLSLQTRLRMQADLDQGGVISDEAAKELFDLLDASDAN